MKVPAMTLRVLSVVVLVALPLALLWSFDGGARSAERRAPAPLPEPGYPMTLEGTTLAAPPERVLLANAFLVDLVSELIPVDRVLGLPEQSLRWSRLATAEGGDDLPGWRAKASFAEASIERVLALQPDLLLCSETNQKLVGADFGRAGIARLTLPHPRTVAELQGLIRLLGRVLDVDSTAERLLAELATRDAALVERATVLPARTALFYSNLGGGGGWSAGRGTMDHEVLRLAGLRNPLAAQGREGHVRLTHEQLLSLDPEVLVVQERDEGSDAGTEDYLRNEPTLQGLRALGDEGRILRLPPRLYASGSQEVYTAAEWIQRELAQGR